MGLAEHAGDDGTAAYPSVTTLAEYTRKSERGVKRDLTALINLELIRRGDQRHVVFIPEGRRPIVYDLAMERTGHCKGHGKHRTAKGQEQNSSSGRGDTHVTSGENTDSRRGDMSVTPQQNSSSGRGDTHVTGDAGVTGGVTPTSPKPPYKPSPSKEGVEGEEFSPSDDPAVTSFVAGLPGNLTAVQRNRIAQRVKLLVDGGWGLDQVRAELTTDVGSAASLAAVYQYRLRHLPASPPEKPARRTIPAGSTHPFVADPDDPDWCASCHKPVSNATHATQSSKRLESVGEPTPTSFAAAEAALAA